MYAVTLEWTIANKSNGKTQALDGAKTLGRATDSTFVISDTTLSRRQAEIYAVANGVRIKNVSDTVKIKIGTTELGVNAEAAITNQLNFTIGNVPFYALIATFPDGSTLSTPCSTCQRPITSATQTCPWCGNPQQEPDGGWTMA